MEIPELRPERPSVVAEVEQLAVVVLPERRGDLQAHSDNEILPVAREVLHRERGRAEQIDRDAKSRVAEARHFTLARLAVHEAMRGERRSRHDDIEFGRLAPEIEGPDIGQYPGIGAEFGVGDRQVRVERHLALGIDVARDQEIQPDGCIRIRPRFGFLCIRICGSQYRRNDCKRDAKRKPARGARFTRIAGRVNSDGRAAGRPLRANATPVH